MRTSYSKKHKVGISVLSGLTAALLILTGCSKSEETVYQIPEDRKLIVYTAHKADVYEPIIKEFEERTGIFVELKAGDTLALFDELQQDAPGTFDVMFGGGVENFEECRDYLEPYKVSEIDQIAEQYRTEGDAYTPFSVLPTVFIYNNKLVYPVAAPRTWEELQTDRWKGKIAFADPTKSGSSYTALCTIGSGCAEDAGGFYRCTGWLPVTLICSSTGGSQCRNQTGRYYHGGNGETKDSGRGRYYSDLPHGRHQCHTGRYSDRQGRKAYGKC